MNIRWKVICTRSHEIPLGDGKFEVYEAGRSYEIADPNPAYFIPVDRPSAIGRKSQRGRKGGNDR
jgi:hypothetical protein